MKKLIPSLEIVLYIILTIISVYGIYLGQFDYDRFLIYVVEDGFVEYLTAIFLFLASIVAFYRVFEYRKLKKPLWVLTAAVLAFLFFFATGEELSWGQRIFNVESSDFFLKHNKQGETNLHNLVVGNVNLNILIFSNLMFVVLVIYFVFSRLLVAKVAFIRKLVIRFRVPLPQYQQIMMMLVLNLALLIFDVKKISEIHELTFAFIFFIIFLNPAKLKEE